MQNRFLVPLALLLFCVACLAIQRLGWETRGKDTASGVLIGEPEPLGSELVLVRTSDSEFLKESAAHPPSEHAAAESTPAEAGTSGVARAGSDGKSAVIEGDGKEVREPEIAGADGKEFKEVLDPKELAPIAAGEATEVGGGGGGFGGGGGGGGPANEVAAFTEVREVEKEEETIITTTDVINKTVIRTVPEVPPVVPVPEAGSALSGLGVAAVIFTSFLRRWRPGVVG